MVWLMMATETMATGTMAANEMMGMAMMAMRTEATKNGGEQYDVNELNDVDEDRRNNIVIIAIVIVASSGLTRKQRRMKWHSKLRKDEDNRIDGRMDSSLQHHPLEREQHCYVV